MLICNDNGFRFTRQNLPTLYKNCGTRSMSIGYAAMQGTFANSKNLGRATLVVADLTERKLDIGSFHFIQRRALAKPKFS